MAARVRCNSQKNPPSSPPLVPRQRVPRRLQRPAQRRVRLRVHVVVVLVLVLVDRRARALRRRRRAKPLEQAALDSGLQRHGRPLAAPGLVEQRHRVQRAVLRHQNRPRRVVVRARHGKGGNLTPVWAQLPSPADAAASSVHEIEHGLRHHVAPLEKPAFEVVGKAPRGARQVSAKVGGDEVGLVGGHERLGHADHGLHRALVGAADLALLVQQRPRLAPVPQLAQPQDGRLLPRGRGVGGERARPAAVVHEPLGGRRRGHVCSGCARARAASLRRARV